MLLIVKPPTIEPVGSVGGEKRQESKNHKRRRGEFANVLVVGTSVKKSVNQNRRLR
ncbi:hypothetical protein RISK_005752 [Rhodopirellula islandica]|uniref:Uncharacterized protein n=1 Tax=Rhodopirellula islandica TaxID=595434 RepID=A0A0J1B8A3_RHOIS|nr:hypothetical protein RISK_005752 [Rhodopirellula islandica]